MSYSGEVAASECEQDASRHAILTRGEHVVKELAALVDMIDALRTR